MAALASRLTDRDRRVILDCYEHRVLATEQLRRLHFRGSRTARKRLQALRELRLLASFRPPTRPGEGGVQNHWVLDEAGALVVAAEFELDRSELRWRAQTALAIASSSKLAHQLAVNEFFTRLAEEARGAGGELECWWGERRSRDTLDGIATPDGYGRLQLPGEPAVELLLELDRGSEDHARLKEKARRYAKALPRSELRDPVVLLLLPSRDRTARAADNLAASAAPIVARTWTPQSEEPVLALARDAHERHHRELEADW
jgi:Replication-relaxation